MDQRRVSRGWLINDLWGVQARVTSTWHGLTFVLINDRLHEFGQA